ncbi:TlpA disulfide reductase family protein [Iamia sp.]|uniref:TlpA family protein disulfide reductase n=1 Tax=Iamia sp. TaxID=2722710 RepID=UPI002C27E61E|nr:TlpA disulfide reductase family protein [Iamia sp.]HXH56646.1 TlpA disulfide reductase family protein [Iamia sp.]
MALRRTRGDGPTTGGDPRADDEGAPDPDGLTVDPGTPPDDDAAAVPGAVSDGIAPDDRRKEAIGDADAASDSDGEDHDGAGADDRGIEDHDQAEGDPEVGGRQDRPSRRLIDARTLALCTLVALIAALVAGLAVSRLTEGDDEDSVPVSELTAAAPAPDVALTRFDGSEVSLADYRGQALVVNFWGSWCAPCVEEMPDLQAVHTSLGDQVTFIGVNIRDEPEAALALAERTGVTYDLVRDIDGDLSRELEITNWPTTVLVLPDGTVVDRIQRKVSAERLCEKINQSLLGGAVTECG